MSKFQEIYVDLKQKIETNEYPVGSLLPGEKILAEDYSVSRETIRKALLLLTENGYIQKQQGKGSTVLDLHRFHFPVSGLTSFKELHDAQKLQSTTTVVKNQVETIPPFLADTLNLPKDTKVISLVRLRTISNEPVILDKDYLLHDIVSTVPEEAARHSLYAYLEDECALPISYAKKEFVVEPATREDHQFLQLQSDTHVVVVKSEVYLEDTRFFQYTESRHRLDRFKFVEFARRNTPYT